MDKITQGRQKTIGTMAICGTILTGKIFLGYAALMTPVMWYTNTFQRFVKQAEIRNRLGNLIIINDEEMQDMILVKTLKHYGVSDRLVEDAKKEFEARRIEQTQNNQTLDAIVNKLRSEGYLKDPSTNTILDKHQTEPNKDKNDDDL